MSRSKNIGTAAESAVTRYAQDNGFPDAERVALAGMLDRGDVRLCRGVIVEVKSGEAAVTASDRLIGEWLDETEAERVNAGASVGILVTKRRAVGHARAGQWWAHVRMAELRVLGWAPMAAGLTERQVIDRLAVRMTLADALTLLRAAGYGEPLP